MAEKTMPLEQYRRRRRFGVTPEPKGKTPRPRTKRLVYVIQKHRATALHYDFRLEWNGVMLSWAVPKGPSLDPKDKRLAMPDGGPSARVQPSSRESSRRASTAAERS